MGNSNPTETLDVHESSPGSCVYDALAVPLVVLQEPLRKTPVCKDACYDKGSTFRLNWCQNDGAP